MITLDAHGLGPYQGPFVRKEAVQMDEEQQDTPVEEQEQEPQGDLYRKPDEIFRFSTYIHLGEGSRECEGGENGRCTDARHFHAWARMPNQFQHADLMKKGNAAKARTARALRDPEADAYVILEASLDDLRRGDHRQEQIDSLMAVEHWQTLYRAMAATEAEEEHEHRNEDVERTRELRAAGEEELSEEEREELAELERHNERYREAVANLVEETEGPKRSALEALDAEGLLGETRELRIKDEGAAAFANAYTRYQWFACTLKPCIQGHPQDRIFKTVTDLDNAAPEIVSAIREAFAGLEQSLQQGVAGN